jgi:hypothetical protein
MIQRIQSIYLFLVVVFTLLYLFFPSGSMNLSNETYKIYSWGIAPEGADTLESQKGFLGYIGLVTAFIIMFLSVYTTFQFKKRIFQIKLGKINILLHLILVVVTFFYLDNLKDIAEQAFSYRPGIIFPLVSMVLILMANRAIRKDENLVRAADRLR